MTGEYPYLEDAGQIESVEDGQEEVSRERNHDGVAEAHHPVLGAVDIHLGRRPQNHDGRHETSEQRQRHGQNAHLSTGHEEFLRRRLLAPTEAVEDADPEGNAQHEEEDGIIPSREHGAARVSLLVARRLRRPVHDIRCLGAKSRCYATKSLQRWESQRRNGANIQTRWGFTAGDMGTGHRRGIRIGLLC